MSTRFVGFFLSVVLLSSLYITIDYAVYENGNIYDILLQDGLFVIDYLVLFGYFATNISRKVPNKTGTYVFSTAYLILFFVGFTMPLLLLKNSEMLDFTEAGQAIGRVFQITAFLIILGSVKTKAIISRKVFKNPITYSFVVFPLIISSTHYDFASLVYLGILFLLCFCCYYIYMEYPHIGWPFIVGISLLVLTEFFYVQKLIPSGTIPIFYLFFARIISSVSELLIAKGFIVLAMDSTSKR